MVHHFVEFHKILEGLEGLEDHELHHFQTHPVKNTQSRYLLQAEINKTMQHKGGLKFMSNQ